MSQNFDNFVIQGMYDHLKEMGCDCIIYEDILQWFKGKGMKGCINKIPNGLYYYEVFYNFPDVKIKRSDYLYNEQRECQRYCIIWIINNFDDKYVEGAKYIFH